jgi:endonuclease YncB( thermonuclease family)
VEESATLIVVFAIRLLPIKAQMYKALICLLIVPATAAADITGLVIGVTDGDTIKVLIVDHQQHKVRLAGIDAPEKGQAFGMLSKQSLSECAFNKQAIIQGDKQDRYKRLVGR